MTNVMRSDHGDFGAQLIEILVFACPTSYMFTSFGIPILYANSSKVMDNSPKVFNFNRLFVQIQRVPL